MDPRTTQYASGLSLLPARAALADHLAELIALAAQGARSDSASLYVVDEAAQVLKPAVVYNLPAEYVAACGDVKIGDQCCGRAVQHRREWIVSDMLTDPLFAAARKAAQVSAIRAGFSVPVIDGEGRVVAALACHYDKPFTPTNYDIERNKMFAKLIAAAIDEQRSQPASAAD
jgi:GAF domain-containing protein